MQSIMKKKCIQIGNYGKYFMIINYHQTLTTCKILSNILMDCECERQDGILINKIWWDT